MSEPVWAQCWYPVSLAPKSRPNLARSVPEPILDLCQDRSLQDPGQVDAEIPCQDQFGPSVGTQVELMPGHAPLTLGQN